MEETPKQPFESEDEEEDELKETSKRESFWKNEDEEPKTLGSELVKALLGDKDEVAERLQTSPENVVEQDNNPENELTQEEKTEAWREIAANHLQNPLDKQPAEAVTEFLGQVTKGTPPEQAFNDTKDSLKDAINAPAKSATTSPPVNGSTETPYSSLPTETVETESGTVNTAPESVPPGMSGETRQQQRQSSETGKKQSLTDTLTEAIVKKRSTTSKVESRAQNERRQIKKQLVGMDAKLRTQEKKLQDLSQNTSVQTERILDRQSNIQRQVQNGNRESRLNLTKPTTQMERLGKVMLNNTKSRSKIDQLNPEQIRHMSRGDLLDLSNDVEVSGGNLRKMYENNLFSEAALRRLLIARSEGRNVNEVLRQEIVRQRAGFEKDPLLRIQNQYGQDVAADIQRSIGSGYTVAGHSLERHDDALVSAPGSTTEDTDSPSTRKAWISLLIVIAILLAIIILKLTKHF